MQFNDFPFSGKAASSCSWWRSHQCLCLVFWTFYRFHLMFWVYLSQRVHAPFLYMTGITAIVHRWIQLNCPWHSLVYSVAPNDSQLPFTMSCWCSMQRFNFFYPPIYLSLHEQSNWYTLKWLLGKGFRLFWYRMLCKSLLVLKVMSLFTFLNSFLILVQY